MKLRIKGNSIRLRVSRSELDRFQNRERVEETIHFAPENDAKLTYALESARQTTPVSVRYEHQSVIVTLSEDQSLAWGKPDEIGIYTSVNIGEAGQLEVIVEKDFACLDRSDEDNADTFTNPHAGSVC
ncbi:hypothetical protein H7849_14390 [Alloacidobacterium dinghuense]|uniref:Uncharacterized protein n=1 Tax=Alloacidobacterium dinghuense TaxID=2763107 RepID=A0A7G8BCT9_9BACT|nr:hypothetical protein [Alloacidobacterium dinghuense]QNI30359.1 hypothetical protein H7849_14390 [Alloacidobacterium dinghuense]